MLQPTLILTAAFLGFLLSAYIHRKRSKQERLVCVLGEDCNKVVYSRYAVTLRIPNELLGMLYYGLIAVSYGFFLTVPGLNTPIAVLAFQAITLLAVVFSWYLIGVQILVLKEWCEWCIASSIFSTLIFVPILFL